ncbi:MAG: hypothetical protein WB558_22690 [Terriglobales bacterium]
MEEYNTSEVPAFEQLIKGILELTKAGVIKWRNHEDQDRATLRLNIHAGMRCSKGPSAIGAEVGGNFVVEGHDTGIGMPNYSLSIVAGDEAKELNVFLRTYPVDTDETDSDAFVAALKNKALNNEQTT